MKELKINIPTTGKEVLEGVRRNAKKILGGAMVIGLGAAAFVLGAKGKKNGANEIDADREALPEAAPEAETEDVEEEDIFDEEIENEEESEQE